MHKHLVAAVDVVAGPIQSAALTGPAVTDYSATVFPTGSKLADTTSERRSTGTPLLNGYGVAYSTSAVTCGRKPAGGFNWTDAAWSSACKK